MKKERKEYCLYFWDITLFDRTKRTTLHTQQLESMFVKHYAPKICFPKYGQICTVP